MAHLDSKMIDSTATNVINPAPGGIGRQVSRTDSLSKGFTEHAEDTEKHIIDSDGPTHADQFGTNTVYSAEEKALVKRLDIFIMPIVFAMYFMNKLDQNAIANARLDSFEKDLKLTGNQFNICVSVLYAGYTLIQVSLFTCVL